MRLRRTSLPVAAALVLVAALAALGGIVLAARRTDAPTPPVHPPHGAFVADVPGARAVLWAVGDGADGGPAARALARRIGAGHPDRFLYLGDVYGTDGEVAGFLEGDGSAKDFRDGYAPVYGALAARTAPTVGNHEWARRGEGYEPYWRAVYGRTPPAWYGFRAGGWDVLSLGSEAPHGPGSPQVRWLERRVAAAPGTCRLAFWHRPRFSAGRHGDQPDVAPLWDALVGHARLVLNGHDHDVQRLRPVDGIVELVDGAGGKSHYAVDRSDRRVAYADDRRTAALRVVLTPGRASWTVVATDGTVLDRGAVRCVG